MYKIYYYALTSQKMGFNWNERTNGSRLSSHWYQTILSKENKIFNWYSELSHLDKTINIEPYKALSTSKFQQNVTMMPRLYCE